MRSDMLLRLNMVVASRVLATSISTHAFMICSVRAERSTRRRIAASRASPEASSGMTSNIAESRCRSGENRTSNKFWYLKSLSRSSGEKSLSLPRGAVEWTARGGREGILEAPFSTACFQALSADMEGPMLTSGIDIGTMRAPGTLSSITVHWPHMTVPRLTWDIRMASPILHCSQNNAAQIRHLLFQRPHRSHSSTPASIGASGLVIWLRGAGSGAGASVFAGSASFMSPPLLIICACLSLSAFEYCASSFGFGGGGPKVPGGTGRKEVSWSMKPAMALD
mmetsp:Transcript_3607/g.8522  ORF Transcript_3607/g.8522 Transcript_3607/m.8522 type:complete len:281 (+) Transcript_3607:885-1727(+)